MNEPNPTPTVGEAVDVEGSIIWRLLRWFKKPVLWEIVGAVIGVFGLYTTFVYERHPRLLIETVTNAPVLDVRTGIRDLQIAYKGIDLANTGKTLRLMTVKVANVGNASILPVHYDADDAVGIAVESGKLVNAPELLEASNSYLVNRVTPHQESDEQSISFNRVILDPGDWFALKLLVLADDASLPSIRMNGKIAGLAETTIKDNVGGSDHESIAVRAFAGQLHIQLIRLFSYTLAALCLIALVALSFDGITSLRHKIRRRRLHRLLEAESAEPPSTEARWLVDWYARRGLAGLAIIQGLINDRISARILLDRFGQNPLDLMHSSAFSEHWNTRNEISRLTIFGALIQLWKKGWITKDSESVAVHDAFRRTFDSFVELLIRHRRLPPNALPLASVAQRIQVIAGSDIDSPTPATSGGSSVELGLGL